MAKIIVEEQKDFSVLPADSILLLKVDELEIRDVQGQHGPWQKLEIKFKVLGIQAVGDGSSPDDYDDVIAGPIWGSVPFRLTDSAENKLRLWSEAILGMELGVGFELDTDLFQGREVRGLTSQYDKRAIDPKTGLKFKGHQITSLLPKAGMNTTAQPVQQNPWDNQQQAPAGGGWATPGQPAAAAAPVNDPWGAGDEPPF